MVTKDVPDYAVLVGNPARVVKVLINLQGSIVFYGIIYYNIFK